MSCVAGECSQLVVLVVREDERVMPKGFLYPITDSLNDEEGFHNENLKHEDQKDRAWHDYIGVGYHSEGRMEVA